MRTRMERVIQKKHHKTADIKEDTIMSFEQVSKDLGKVIEYIHADKLDDAVIDAVIHQWICRCICF